MSMCATLMDFKKPQLAHRHGTLSANPTAGKLLPVLERYTPDKRTRYATLSPASTIYPGRMNAR